MMLEQLPAYLPELLLWGLIATIAMTTVLQASQGLRFSRLSLPFLVGTFLTGRRSAAQIVGFIVYVIGGWLFAIVYFAFFFSIGSGNWWIGTLFGIAHGVALLVVFLPLIPYIHPRMASEYDGPTRRQRLEPPGFMGLNYGYRTPLSVLLAQALYGAVLGSAFSLSHPIP
jgi:hypothetical protein